MRARFVWLGAAWFAMSSAIGCDAVLGDLRDREAGAPDASPGTSRSTTSGRSTATSARTAANGTTSTGVSSGALTTGLSAGESCSGTGECADVCCIECHLAMDMPVEPAHGVCAAGIKGDSCTAMDAGTGYWVRACGGPTDCIDGVCCHYAASPPDVCQTAMDCYGTQVCGNGETCSRPEENCCPVDGGFACRRTCQ